MFYSLKPPFEIISNGNLTAPEIAKLKIFAEFWDLLANSGRFPGLKDLAAGSGENPFGFFYALSRDLYAHFQRTHSIHLVELEKALANCLRTRGLPEHSAIAAKKPHAPSAAAAPERQVRHLQG
jgi:hypothetical protein